MGRADDVLRQRVRLTDAKGQAATRAWLVERALTRWPAPPPMWLTMMLGGVGLWAAFPPLGWSFLGWLVPLLWMYGTRQPHCPRGYYRAMYVSALLFWLPTLQGIRLPYWALYFGWLALSAYLAAYLPLWAAIVRWAVHRGGWPHAIAAPLSWALVEWLRGQGPLGFSGALLGHSQLHVPMVIQVADLSGGYTVSFVMVAVGACLLEAVMPPRRPVAGLAGAFLLLVAVCAYGCWQLHRTPHAPLLLRAALLQANYDTVFEYNPERNLQMFEDYLRLARHAGQHVPGLQLIVWPESAFTENNPCWLVREPFAPPPRGPSDGLRYAEEVRKRAEAFRQKCKDVARLIQPPRAENRPVWQIVGTEVVELQGPSSHAYNSALLLDAEGNVRARYDKMHLVIFGEYLPFGKWFPWIYRLSPLRGGITPGQQPCAFLVDDCTITVNICFESTVPHLITRHLRRLQRAGSSVNVLVNITHDGWFWGSSILDLHLACSAFRAVENRRPLLMAANPGITAWIDGNGQIVRQLPRREVSYLIADVVRDDRLSLYSWWGDIPVMVSGLVLLSSSLCRTTRRRLATVARTRG